MATTNTRATTVRTPTKAKRKSTVAMGILKSVDKITVVATILEAVMAVPDTRANLVNPAATGVKMSMEVVVRPADTAVAMVKKA